jgi:hypothetical protein
LYSREINGFLPGHLLTGVPVRRYLSPGNGIDQLTTTGAVRKMAQDITGIIRTMQTSAVDRCRERLDAAALKARSLINRGEDDAGKDPAHDDQEHGVTSVLKRRHGL